ARLKFMKKDSAETAAVAGLMQHLALSHPDISFQLIKDGEEALHTPGDGQLLSAVYAAMGREFAKSLVEVRGGGDVPVTGFVTSPLACRGSRGMQVFFVNGRFIKSQLLTAALEEAYRNQMMKGKFPGCVLSVTVPVTQVDVNVHPAKTQVKFAREHDVFDAVYRAVLSALTALGAANARTEEAQSAPREDFFRRMDAETYRRSAAPAPAAPAPRMWDTELRADAPLFDSVRPAFAATADAFPKSPRAEEKPPRPAIPAIPAEEPRQTELAPRTETPWRIAGELLRTYIVCEDADENVWLIDKHAAHERVNFDRLKAEQAPPMRQTLLTPVAAELGGEDAALLLDAKDLTERFGFSFEDFGGGTLMVREIPADLAVSEVVPTLEAFAADLRAGKEPNERREALLRTMACKASIKGGWESDPAELRALVEKVQSGAIRYCPHGRPVAVKLTKYELEKMFRRS
ncbi:MAG: DNA mismatch repair protein MutL, partial [Oscillibacter sp.]|nr:DNA mismatch repair protein MutL [Oscillibacter sp.]